MLIALPHHHQGAMAKTTLTQPTLAEQYDVVIGVDTHKDFHVAGILQTNRAIATCGLGPLNLGQSQYLP